MNIMDFINGSFEAFASLFILRHCWVLYQDKLVRGVSVLATAFFFVWGLWNILYYPSLEQTFSFYVGIFVCLANFLWIGLILYYRKQEVKSKQTQENFIELSDGRFWHFNKLKNRLTPQVMAHSLGNLCRYTGHCKEFYSVAEHCVKASYLVEPQYAMEALLHDAHECLTNDLSKPFKNQIVGSYKEWEDKLEALVRNAYNIPVELDPSIKIADIKMLFAESKILMPSEGVHYMGADMYAAPAILRQQALEDLRSGRISIDCWDQKTAAQKWLNRYHELKETERYAA